MITNKLPNIEFLGWNSESNTKQIHELKKRKVILNKQIAKCDAEKNNEHAHIEAEEQAINNCQIKMNEMTAEIENTNTELHELKRTIESLNPSNKLIGDEIAQKLRDTFKSAKVNVENSKRKLRKLQVKHIEYRKSLETHQNKMDELTNILKRSKEELTVLIAKLEVYNEEEENKAVEKQPGVAGEKRKKTAETTSTEKKQKHKRAKTSENTVEPKQSR